jgi:PAS domain S-box-containing protein
MSHPHPDIIAEAARTAAAHPKALVTLIDVSGIFHYVSESAVSLVGYEPREAIGKPFIQFVDPTYIDHLALAIQDALLNERSVTITMRAKVKSGGFRALRGFAQKLVDPATDEIFILSRAEAVD